MVEGEVIVQIVWGLLVFVGVEKGDDLVMVMWCVDKLVGLCVFEDEEGCMNFVVQDVEGEILVVFQFILVVEISKG